MNGRLTKLRRQFSCPASVVWLVMIVIIIIAIFIIIIIIVVIVGRQKRRVY